MAVKPETTLDPAAATRAGTYNFLDVGNTRYGECILVEFGDLRILIDGSHPQDFKGQRGCPSIPDQLQDILGPPPHDIALIVVTHCHADHVGCLPELVARDIVRPRFALLTHPQLGFGRRQNDDASPAGAEQPGTLLAAMLREEDASDLDDDDLDAFIDAVAGVESRYQRFVEDLRDRGVHVSIHRGGKLGTKLATLLRPTGARLLGPSEAQLLLCAEQISATNKQAEDAADGAPNGRRAVADLYRAITVEDADAGRTPRGSGMNCQSMVFAFGPPSARVLLAGDMQFAEPGVQALDRELTALRRAVVDAGPYKLFKTTHHTSHNGQDDAFLDALGSPPLIVHSGGLRDEDHPFPGVLEMLKRRPGVFFARTDRNGRITARPAQLPGDALLVSKGALNDFEPNVFPDAPKPASPALIAAEPVQPPPPAGVQIVIVNLPAGSIDLTVAGVEIQIRTPAPRPARPKPAPVLQTIPSSKSEPASADDAMVIAPGRSIDKLLFVTDPDRLTTNIGESQADAALAAIKAQGGELLTGDGASLAAKAQQRLSRSQDRDGLVILGGYDVVPSHRRNVLDDALRKKLGDDLVGIDLDRYWVWSDASYGDLDDDKLAELPISRIPDADADLFRTALTAAPLELGERFGIRNVDRPFALDVWQEVAGTRRMNATETFALKDIVADELASSCHYYMLHGSDSDATVFKGETRSKPTAYLPSFNIGAVPRQFRGVVFCGCCWGALIVRSKAVDSAARMPPSREPGESIALAFLRSGAVAFIGCTGSHYSGSSSDPEVNHATRLHRAFWTSLRAGAPPARALFEAKTEYAAAIVARRGRLDASSTARQLKNLAQFTCLGLGW